MYDLMVVTAAGVLLGGALATSVAGPKTALKPKPASTAEGLVRLLIRGDDIGSSHAANIATIRCYRDGIMRSAELMVPCPWFPEAVQMLEENPGLDVGVHLTLTAEWDAIKWGPVSHAPSLVDEDGYFFPMTGSRGEVVGRDFISCGYRLEEVERELKAQIELALKHVRNVSHVSSHMHTCMCRPELQEITTALAKKYGLHLGVPDSFRHFSAFEGATDYANRPEAMAQNLAALTPGDYLFVDHPGLDDPEMQAMGHEGYRQVAAERAAVTAAFTDAKVKQVVESRQIQLISYARANS